MVSNLLLWFAVFALAIRKIALKILSFVGRFSRLALVAYWVGVSYTAIWFGSVLIVDSNPWSWIAVGPGPVLMSVPILAAKLSTEAAFTAIAFTALVVSTRLIGFGVKADQMRAIGRAFRNLPDNESPLVSYLHYTVDAPAGEQAANDQKGPRELVRDSMTAVTPRDLLPRNRWVQFRLTLVVVALAGISSAVFNMMLFPGRPKPPAYFALVIIHGSTIFGMLVATSSLGRICSLLDWVKIAMRGSVFDVMIMTLLAAPVLVLNHWGFISGSGVFPFLVVVTLGLLGRLFVAVLLYSVRDNQNWSIAACIAVAVFFVGLVFAAILAAIGSPIPIQYVWIPPITVFLVVSLIGWDRMVAATRSRSAT